MARADLLYELIKYGLSNDNLNFRKVAETICAEERAKQHGVLANKIEEILKTSNRSLVRDNSIPSVRNGNGGQNLFIEKIPERKLDQLLLPQSVLVSCRDLIEEQSRADLLHSYGLEPRNKILLVGPPGNGKTSLAEALAEELMLPFLTVKYESLVGAYLGETALERVENGSASILYISPESLRSKTIERLLLGRNVVCFVIDAGLLIKNGRQAKLIQSNEGFSLYNLLKSAIF